VDTPLMQQYRDIKARHPQTILFFRMGDFYEMFEDDARLAARELGLTLTTRNNGGAAEVPLAGVPVKAAAEYLRRLIGKGHRVAICEQVEDPKLAKGLVRREVVETVTPGSVLADDWVAQKRNNFLVSVEPRGGAPGLAALDLTTGEFVLELVEPQDLSAALARYEPLEVLLPAGTHCPLPDGATVTEREAWEFDPELAREDLLRSFRLASLDGLGVAAADRPALGAAGALVRYARELKPGDLPHVARPRILRRGDVVPLDEMTRRNLELVEPLRPGTAGATLLEVLDGTVTPMGGRRCWRRRPIGSSSCRTWATSSPAPSWTARPLSSRTATPSGQATTGRWTSSKTRATAASGTSPRCRRGSASAPVSRRSRSGSTRYSAITSRSRTPTRRESRRITSGARLSPALSAT